MSERQRGLAVDGNGIAAGEADSPGREAACAGALEDVMCGAFGGRDQVAALILSESQRVGRQAIGQRVQHDADVSSQGHFRDGDEQAAV